jgi:phosphoglycolate phosphatase-like HAD superfamily hydrolase
MPQFPPGQTLLIDADDTLWENNVYFERAIAAFISYLNHHAYSPAEVRKALNAVERETILTHGYGLTSFTRSLVTCFERLSPAPVTEEKCQRILGLRPLHRRAGDRTAPRRSRDPRRVGHPPPPHPHDQGQPRRAG